MNKMRSSQKGSTMTFVIVGIILTVGLIGTIVVLRQHGEQVRKEQAIAAYDKQQASKKATEVAEKTSATKSDNTNSDTELVNTADELPTTGIKNVITDVLGLSLLTMSIMGYLLSRRSIVHSL